MLQLGALLVWFIADDLEQFVAAHKTVTLLNAITRAERTYADKNQFTGGTN